MATKRGTAAAAEEVKDQETAVEQEAVQAKETVKVEDDPWKKMVEVRVPRYKAGDAPYYYICVNDRRYQIPADGRKQSMPQPIAELLEKSIEAEYDAEKFAETMSE